ncbi:hypothetical protein [Nocardiopsis sp. LOL_012]|uniref:hypothetical protein n=1 Tax=Nocardiopsis sp. LOL_012 TaxID=3345409 RepID=UPI003A84B6CB
MDAIAQLDRPALLAIGEAVDLIAETTEDLRHGYGDHTDLNAYTNRLHRLCAEHGINPADAIDTFA